MLVAVPVLYKEGNREHESVLVYVGRPSESVLVYVSWPSKLVYVSYSPESEEYSARSES
jgi:hypothetical protein